VLAESSHNAFAVKKQTATTNAAAYSSNISVAKKQQQTMKRNSFTA